MKILRHLCRLVIFFCTFLNILSRLCALGCPVNTYQSEERICVPCPANSHTAGDGNIREGCICDEGFTGSAGGSCNGNVSCLHSNHCFQISGESKAGSHLTFAFAGTPPPKQCMLGDTGNKRAVRILLECNLVNFMQMQTLGTNTTMCCHKFHS